jgi:hypothetical protein
MGTVNSSFLKAIGFSGAPGKDGTLRIQFKDATLDFFDVPYHLYRGLVLSKDPSGFYFTHIAGEYEYSKV